MKTLFTIKMKTATELERSVRKTWTIMPGTKVFKTKRDYSRHQGKLLERNALREY